MPPHHSAAARAFLLVLVLCTPSGGSGQLDRGSDGEGSDDDVDCRPDISDIMDYDPVTQTSARCERMKRERRLAKDRCASELASAKQSLEECLKGSECSAPDCPPPPTDGPLVPDCAPCPAHADDMFFYRLTRHLVNILQDTAADSGPIEASLKVQLTSHEWKKLQRFAAGGSDYRKADIHDTLVGMTMDVVHLNRTSWSEWLSEQFSFRSPGIPLFLMSVLVASVIFGVGMFSDLYWNGRFMGCLFLAVFVISLFWNWIYLYQEETLKRYREAQKHPGIPPSCLPHQMTWVQSLTEWYRTAVTVKTDPCMDYYRMYLVDPLLDIPPTRALAFTVSSFFVDPMKYFGRAVGEFHSELFRGLPYWLGALALVSTYVFMFVFAYSFVAAPRRVRRERPLPRGMARPVEHQQQQHRILGQVPGRQQLQLNGAEVDHDDHYGGRIENVALPTLPPRDEEEQNPRNEDGMPAYPSGRNVPHPGANMEGQASPGKQERRKKKGAIQGGAVKTPHDLAAKTGAEEGNRPRPSTSAQEDGPSSDNAPADCLQEARSSQAPHRKDPDRADVSRSSIAMSKMQRPTRLPKSGGACGGKKAPVTRSASVGEPDSSTVICHPSSERSDAESLAGSAVCPASLQETSACCEGEPSEGTWTSPGACASPASADSPSDYSIISPSPENTNSATYEFISTSLMGLSESAGCSHSPVQSEDQHGDSYHDDDDDDDFVVLKKETH